MMKRFKLYASLFILISACIPEISIAGHPAQFIWVDEITDQRQIYAYFRYDFFLDDHPVHAEINLFADSRYHLFVNGDFVNFGPARTFPENPEYDTYDLMPCLKQGDNYIVAMVLWNGMETFQLLMNKPGFVAWGRIEAGNPQGMGMCIAGAADRC